MSENEKPGPVDNSHLDAGIAARDAQKSEVVEDVAKKAATIVEDDDDAQNEPEESAAPEGDTHKPRKGVGKRIDELTKEKHDERRAREDAQRERDYWRELATRQQPKDEPPPVQAATEESGEPTLESCDFDQAQFQRQWYTWRREQEKRQEVLQAKGQKFAEKEAAFRAEHPDYDTLVRNPALPLTKGVVEVITETDDPPAVAYYLAQNPQEAAAIAQMTPNQIGRAIGRIEANLARSKEQPASETPRQPEPRTVTRAPAPVTTLSGAPAIKKSYEDMGQAEYEAARKKEREAKGLNP